MKLIEFPFVWLFLPTIIESHTSLALLTIDFFICSYICTVSMTSSHSAFLLSRTHHTPPFAVVLSTFRFWVFTSSLPYPHIPTKLTLYRVNLGSLSSQSHCLHIIIISFLRNVLLITHQHIITPSVIYLFLSLSSLSLSLSLSLYIYIYIYIIFYSLTSICDPMVDTSFIWQRGVMCNL